METADKTQQPQTDFDMLASIAGFFRSIKRGIRYFFIWIGNFLVWLLNIHIRYFFLFLVLLAALGFWSFQTKRSVSHSCSGETMIYCNGYDNFTLNQIVSKLNIAIAQNDTAYLSSILNMPAETCSLLQKITLGVGIDSDDDGLPNIIKFKNQFEADQYTKGELLNTKKEGQVMQRQPKVVKIPDLAVIQLSIRSDNPRLFSQIADTVLYYLNHHPELTKMYRSYISGLQYTLNIYNTQINALDSLQKIEYLENSRKSKTAQSKDLYLAAMVTSSRDLTAEEMARISSKYTFFHEDILSLMEERNKVQNRFDLATSPVTVLSGFVPSVANQSAAWYWFPILMSVLLTAAAGGCIDSRKKIGAYIKEQRKRR